MSYWHGDFMEFIVNTAQFEKMIDNKIIGVPTLIDSNINFRGKNNILVCDNNIKLERVKIDFNGDNSIVYVASNLSDSFNLTIYNNSTVFIGKNSEISSNVSINILESQNLIIGDDCVIGKNVSITTSNGYSIYNSNNKQRINFPNNVLIGDHVLIGDNSFISQGVIIGSGAILDNASFIRANVKIPSNYFLSGNPAKIIRKDVFFTNEFTGSYNSSDSLNFKEYISDVFIFEVVDQESLSPSNINQILNDLDVESRLDFIQKLFVSNKRKNRFAIM